MECRIISYGEEGWNEKNRIVERIIASRSHAPFLYSDILVLVSTSRMKRLYERFFLNSLQQRHKTAALTQPTVLEYNQFLDTLYARLRKPRIIDENSRLVLLEGIVKQRLITDTLFSQRPDILAPSLSSALAEMINQLSAAGVAPEYLSKTMRDTEFFDKSQVRLLIDVYARYQSELRKRMVTDPAGRNAVLINEFDPSWIAQYREIIIDGIYDAEKLEAIILRKIATSGNVTFLIEAPSPEALNTAKDFHPLRITKNFISSVGIIPTQKETKTSPEQSFLATALFSDKPFEATVKDAPPLSSISKEINLLSAVNIREEVSLIAGRVKKTLRNGTPADSVLVAFPTLDEYAPLVEELFTDYGIPYNRALGRQLSTSPVTTSIVSLLQACQEDFSGSSLLRIFSSPFLKFAEQPALTAGLDRLMRVKRINGGREKLLSALKYFAPDEQGANILTTSLHDLFTALAPFSTQDIAPLGAWMDRLSALIAWSGIDGRVDTVPGALNVNLQAFRKLNETLASLARAGVLFPEYRYTFHEWLFLLKKTFMRSRFQVPPEDEGGVQILGLEESTGHLWKEIYLGGLTDGKFPQRLPQNIFLPEATLERLEIRTLERARLKAANHFYRLLLSAKNVTLTYPENEEDKPVVPSPFLKELTPLRKAGLLNRGIAKTAEIQFSLTLEESNSVSELAKAISLARDTKGLTKILNAEIEGLSGIKSALDYQPAERTATAIPQGKKKFWVTELDDYLACPYDYYVRHVLGIEPLEEVTEDISPLDRGSKIHAILRNFYYAWEKPVERENRNEAKALLQKLADSAFAREADTIRNRREKDLFLNRMTERFLDAEEEFWKQKLRPAYLEQKIESFRLTLSSGDIVELSAKIDRIDVDETGNFIIVDYKTGNYPQPKIAIEQEIFQLPVYAVMAVSSLSDKEPFLRTPLGLAYYDLAGKTEAGARDVVLYNKDLGETQPASKPTASTKSAEEFETILKQSLDKARKAVEGILAGEFAFKPRDESRCRYCPNKMMCGKQEP